MRSEGARPFFTHLHLPLRQPPVLRKTPCDTGNVGTRTLLVEGAKALIPRNLYSR